MTEEGFYVVERKDSKRVLVLAGPIDEIEIAIAVRAAFAMGEKRKDDLWIFCEEDFE